MIPQDWTIYDSTPMVSLAAQIDALPNGVRLKVRYVDRRTHEEDEVESVAASLTDCIHQVGVTIRDGSTSGRPARPVTADGVTELICRYIIRNRAQIDRALAGA